jgi:hypothetical protein
MDVRRVKRDYLRITRNGPAGDLCRSEQTPSRLIGIKPTLQASNP